MSNECKGKYEVIRVLRNNIILGLNELGLQPSEESELPKWDVMEFAQASFENADKIILLQHVGNNRIGFLDTKYFTDGEGRKKRKDEWLEEQFWQYHVILKRDGSPVTSDTQTVEDIASLLISWLNGPGIDNLRENGMSVLRIDDSDIFVYNDDSDLYQRRAMFTAKVHISKTFVTGVGSIARWQSGIYPV